MILVIGGTGKVGIEVLKQLSKSHIQTKMLSRSSKSAKMAEELNIEAVTGDLEDLSSLEKALTGIERLFLLAPPTQNEAELKKNAIDVAKKVGVRRIVMLSGAGASKDSPISQAQQHAKADDYLKNSEISFSILQPYFFMQNFIAQAGAIKSQNAVYGNYSDGLLAMVDARDIAAVAVACLQENGHAGKTYVISGSEAISFSDAAEALTSLLKREINYVNMPSQQLVQGLTAMGYPAWLASDLTKLGENIANGQFSKPTSVVSDILKRDAISFKKFLTENLSSLL